MDANPVTYCETARFTVPNQLPIVSCISGSNTLLHLALLRISAGAVSICGESDENMLEGPMVSCVEGQTLATSVKSNILLLWTHWSRDAQHEDRPGKQNASLGSKSERI